MLQLFLILCLYSNTIAEPLDGRSPRAIGSLTASNYDTEFTAENQEILRAYNLFNKKLVRDTSVNPTSVTIGWTQAARCFFGCEEEYLLVDYYQDGDKSNPVMKVYVAKSELSPPNQFSTSGYQKLLHYGFLYYGGQNQAIFFVLHPNSWGPYQHRFKTNAFTAFFNTGIKTATSTTVGAVIGSIVPGVGTIIGGLTGAAVGSLTDDYFGDYLRYIG